jgi:hypothetical protein
MFKTSVRTSKRTQHFTITKINWLIVFKEVTEIYCKKHKNPQIQNAATNY